MGGEGYLPGIPARKQLIWVDGNLSLRLQTNMPHENPTGSQIWTLNRSSYLNLVTRHGSKLWYPGGRDISAILCFLSDINSSDLLISGFLATYLLRLQAFAVTS